MMRIWIHPYGSSSGRWAWHAERKLCSVGKPKVEIELEEDVGRFSAGSFVQREMLQLNNYSVSTDTAPTGAKMVECFKQVLIFIESNKHRLGTSQICSRAPTVRAQEEQKTNVTLRPLLHR